MPGIQGNRIDGSNGSWATETDHTVNPEEIKIKFTPNDGTCKDVRLVQHVKVIAIDKDGNRVANDTDGLYVDPADNPYAWEKPDWVLNPGGTSVYIDHLKCEGDPFYNGEDPQDTSSKGDATTHPPTPTEMTDNPRQNFDDTKSEIATIHTIFETCAICAQTGDILGCIWWSAISTPTNPGQITVNTGQHDEPGSETMKKALAKFISRHTRKDKDGNLHWFCPETGTMRGLVPEKYSKKILESGLSIRTLTRPSIYVGADQMFTIIELPRDGVGGATLVEDPEIVIAKCEADPAQAALKFTWSGAQQKTKLSFVFSMLPNLSAADIAPFVRDEDRFANDFVALRQIACPESLIAAFLAGLRNHADELRETTGVVTVSIIADLRTESAFGYTGTLEPAQLVSFLNAVNPATATTGSEIREAMNYLNLNFANRRSISWTTTFDKHP